MPEASDIPGYEILSPLGQGGMGAVYRARQVELDREVALKVLRRDALASSSRLRFLREAEVMARVRHPNLIEVYDAGEAGEDLWIAMELVRGRTIEQVIKEEGSLPTDEARRIWMDVAGALGALHAQGILHRDVKPANVILEDGGRVVLMDLGLARDEERTQVTRTGHLLGTPIYLSPELLTGKEWVPSDDLYALGVSWWESLAGRRPFGWKDVLAGLRRGKAMAPAPVESPLGKVSAAHQVLLAALCGPRRDRPSDVAALQKLIRAVEDDRTCILPRTEDVPRSYQLSGAVPPSPARMGLAALAAGLVVLAGAAVIHRTLTADRVEPTPPELRVVARHRGVRGLVLEGEYPDPGAVRAWRQLRGRRVPVPVFAREETSFLVWLTGLTPEARGEIRLSAGDPAREVAESYGPAGPEVKFPVLLRRFQHRSGDARLSGKLAEMRAVVDTGRPIETEGDVTMEISRFNSIPDALWPTLLGWLEEPGPISSNTLRMLKFAEPRIPPVVTWHLAHRLVDVHSGPGRDHGMDVRVDIFEGAFVPPALFPRLAEWEERPALRRGCYRLGQEAARTLASYPEHRPFPHRIPGWREERREAPEGDPLADLGEDPLSRQVAQAIRSHRGKQVSGLELVRAARGAGTRARWATVLLPVAKVDGLVPDLLERYSTAKAAELEAVATALWGLRTVVGMWTPSEGWILTVGAFGEWPVERVEVEGRGAAGYRSETGLFFAHGPGSGFEITLQGAGDRRARWAVSATEKPKRLP